MRHRRQVPAIGGTVTVIPSVGSSKGEIAKRIPPRGEGSQPNAFPPLRGGMPVFPDSLIRSPLGWYGLLEKPGMLVHWSDYRDPQRIRRFFPTGESYASSSFHLRSTTFDLHTSRRSCSSRFNKHRGPTRQPHSW